MPYCWLGKYTSNFRLVVCTQKQGKLANVAHDVNIQPVTMSGSEDWDDTLLTVQLGISGAHLSYYLAARCDADHS